MPVKTRGAVDVDEFVLSRIFKLTPIWEDAGSFPFGRMRVFENHNMGRLIGGRANVNQQIDATAAAAQPSLPTSRCFHHPATLAAQADGETDRTRCRGTGLLL
jgi:hypothetical protein